MVGAACVRVLVCVHSCVRACVRETVCVSVCLLVCLFVYSFHLAGSWSEPMTSVAAPKPPTPVERKKKKHRLKNGERKFRLKD